jgi:hypothetical protein
MRRTKWIICALSGLLLAAAGCDRDTSAPSGTSQATETDPNAAGPVLVELAPITPLLPRLRTHVAVDGRGNLYWVQESEPTPAGGDLVFVMGDSGVPQTIPALSVPNVLATLGAAGGNGSIRSIATGPDNNLYALFVGGQGRLPLWAIVQFAPITNRLKVVADTRRLMSESRMGASIDLARGTLVSYDRDLWLWLRHSDDAAILQVIPGDVEGQVDLRRVVLKPPKGVGLPISEQDDLSAGPAHALYYVDRVKATLWKIDSTTSDYVAVQPLEGFSRALTAPAVDRTARICFLVGEGDPLYAKDTGLTGPPPAWTQVAYPAFVQMPEAGVKGAVITNGRDDFRAPPALPLQDLQPRHLLLDRTTGTLITFDAASGELLRVKLIRK